MSKRNTYTLAGETYRTKQAVTQRCRDILSSTDIGETVDAASARFLLDLFSHHTEWAEKQAHGVSSITVQDTGHGTRCFWLVGVDGRLTDISFMHAIKHLPTSRTSSLQPQALVDFKNAARRAIKDQIDGARQMLACESGYEVDHLHPRTFDALLFGFCVEHQVNPLEIEVIEQDGCLHHMTDDAIRAAWQGYHKRHAMLRSISKKENLSAPKAKIDWARLWATEGGQISMQEPDVYTRTCPVCGNTYQADEHDDPNGEWVWSQWEGPCCVQPGITTPA